MNRDEVIRLGETMLAEHGLREGRWPWQIAIESKLKTKYALAQCDRVRRVISIGPRFADHAPESHLREAFAHEIAHALTPNDPGHGKAWKALMRRFGYEPRSHFPHWSFSYIHHKPRYYFECYICNSHGVSYRKRSVEYMCGKCFRDFLLSTPIVWQEIDDATWDRLREK